MGGRFYTKESGRNNVREINSRDVVTGYREQRKQGNRHTYSTLIEISRENSERLQQKRRKKQKRTR